MGEKLVHQLWILKNSLNCLVGFLGSKEVVLSFDNPCWYALFIEQIRKQHATIDPLGIFLRRSAVSVLFLNRSLSCLSCGSRARGERRGEARQECSGHRTGRTRRWLTLWPRLRRPSCSLVCLSVCLPLTTTTIYTNRPLHTSSVLRWWSLSAVYFWLHTLMIVTMLFILGKPKDVLWKPELMPRSAVTGRCRALELS